MKTLRGLKYAFSNNDDPLIVSQHEFLKCTYRSFAWCGHCSELMWGLGNQGWRCKCKTLFHFFIYYDI